MSWLSNIIQSAGSRVVHIPAAEVQEYVDNLNALRNPDGDPSIPDLTVTDWRFFEKAFLMGVTNHALQQATPRAAEPVGKVVAPVVVQAVGQGATPAVAGP